MSFRRGLANQATVVHALILRETRTRFGVNQMGYLWALIEPMLMILTFFVLFRMAHRAAPEGMDLYSFVATGIVPYALFASSANRISQAIRGNTGLLFYPQVQPLDLVYARSILEAATHAAVFIVIMLIHALYYQRFEVDSLLLTIAGFGFASLLGTALGLVFCTLDQFSQAMDRARGPLMRPLFWVSGIFFTAEALPDHVRDLLLYNPLLHSVELVRAGWFVGYDARHVDIGYVIACIMGLLFVGVTLERVVRQRIQLT